jgi:transcriptional regulator with XRE-family HTH domain
MSKRNQVLAAFGSNVRKAREAKDFTQEKLAEKADLDQTYISGIERGLRNPSVVSIVRIAKALGTTVSEISKGIER